MSASSNNTTAQCAACGKDDDGLKKCGACELVRYCSIDCQRAHRPQHKKACKRRAAELYDEALFKQPPSREDCPICFLELPLYSNMQMYKGCCGKIVCDGCVYAHAQQADECRTSCPFCREPTSRTVEESMRRIERRVELKDPRATFMMGAFYADGEYGLSKNIDKAIELFLRAAELGSINAHFNLGIAHHRGDGVQVDKEKTKHHYEKAVIAGHIRARHDLGTLEANGGNLHRAMKHFIISANAGHDDSLKKVHCGFRDGLVNKDDFEKTLRAHQKSQDETRSEWRDKAAAARMILEKTYRAHQKSKDETRSEWRDKAAAAKNREIC